MEKYRDPSGFSEHKNIWKWKLKLCLKDSKVRMCPKVGPESVSNSVYLLPTVFSNLGPGGGDGLPTVRVCEPNGQSLALVPAECYVIRFTS